MWVHNRFCFFIPFSRDKFPDSLVVYEGPFHIKQRNLAFENDRHSNFGSLDESGEY